MQSQHSRRLRVFISGILLLWSGSAAFSQGAGSSVADSISSAGGVKSTVIETITVTARRREELLQEVPASVSAFTEADLERRAAISPRDLGQSVPNLNYENVSGLGNSAKIYIRGVGQEDFTPTRDMGVGVYLDGVYLARMSAPQFDLFDIERFEVLRGPQGTLFGRNTVGGAIHITSVRPKMEFESKLAFDLGNFSAWGVKGMLNTPLGSSDKLAIRANVYSRNADGWQRNLADGSDFASTDAFGSRLALRYAPNDTWEFNMVADQLHKSQSPPVAKCVYIQPVVAGAQPLLDGLTDLGFDLEEECRISLESAADEVSVDTPGNDDIDAYGLSATAEWTPGASGPLGDISVKAILSWRRQEWTLLFDDDMSAAPLSVEELVDNPNDEKQYTAELQLTGKAIDERLNYVVGLYYFSEDAFFEDNFRFYPNTDFDTGPLPVRTDAEASSFAVYGEASYDLTSQLTLTAGLRNSAERKSMDILNVAFADPSGPPFEDSPSERFSSWTPRINLRYKISDEFMVYGGYSRGFRSGGFNAFASDSGSAAPFGEETLDQYEVGAKFTGLDQRLQVNASYFFGNYSDIQLLTFGQVGAISTINNAAEGRLQGVELEAIAVVADGVRLEVGLGTLSAEYTDFTDIDPDTGDPRDRSGLEFPNAPDLTFNAAIDYRRSVSGMGEWSTRVMWYQQSRVYFDVPNTPEAQQGSYGLLSARMALLLPDEKTQIAIWGKNLLDKEYLNTAFSQPFVNSTHIYFAPPRSYGLQVTRRFD